MSSEQLPPEIIDLTGDLGPLDLSEKDEGEPSPVGDNSGGVRTAFLAPVLDDAHRLERYEFDIGPVPCKKLLNYNQGTGHHPAARNRGQHWWQGQCRAAYVSGVTLGRVRVVLRFWFADLQHRDVGNLHPTAKGIVDGLVTQPNQFGWIADDNDRIVVGPDLRRGLDRTVPRRYCRITVTLIELEPTAEAWWLE